MGEWCCATPGSWRRFLTGTPNDARGCPSNEPAKLARQHAVAESTVFCIFHPGASGQRCNIWMFYTGGADRIRADERRGELVWDAALRVGLMSSQKGIVGCRNGNDDF